MKKSSSTSCGLQVAVRVRPLNARERQNSSVHQAIETGENYLTVKLGENETIYAFDSVFGVESRTLDLFSQVAEPIVQSSMSGVNGTIFAYGQTSSGKTFTMQGSEEEPGILRLAARKLFAPNEKWSFTIAVSYIEIYNERVKDLLSAPATASNKMLVEEPDLKIREDPTRGFFVEGVMERQVQTYAEFMQCFAEGEKKRHVAGTDMNEKSSRSHTIFSVSITAKPMGAGLGSSSSSGGLFKSKLSLVDLAGSESGRSTNAEGERLKEGGQINKSLLTLSMVISSLASASGQNKSHVKFRDSKLTQILQPSLVGNCMTAVVCCVTPASTFINETNSTLKFANNAKQLKTEFVVNQIVDANMRTAKAFQDQIEALELALRRESEERKSVEEALVQTKQSLDEETARVVQTKILLDSARHELERSRESHNLVEEKASSSLEQLAERSARELQDLTERFQEEIATRRNAEAKLRQELAAHTNLVQTTQAQNDLLVSDLQEASARVESTSNELRAANSSAFALQMLVEEKAEESAQLRAELAAVCLQREEVQALAQHWESNCAVQVEQVRELTCKLQDREAHATKLAANLNSCQRECDSLMKDLDLSIQATQEHEARVVALQAELASAKQLNVDCTEQFEAERAKTASELQARAQQVEALRAELETAKRESLLHAEESRARVVELDASQQRTASLQAELIQAEKLVSTLEAKLKDASLEKETCSVLLQGKLDAQLAIVADLSNKLAEGQAELQAFKHAADAGSNALMHKIGALEEDIDLVRKENGGLLVEIAAAKQAVAIQETLVVSGQTANAELRSACDEAKRYAQNLQTELQGKAVRVTDLEAELKSAQDASATLHKELDAATQGLQEFKSLLGQRSEEYNTLRVELEGSHQQASALEAELNKTMAKLSAAQSHTVQLEQALVASKQETAKMDAVHAELEARSLELEQDLKAKTSAMDDLRAQVLNLESARDALQQSVAAGQVAMEGLENALATSKKQVAELESALSNSNESAKQELGLRSELCASLRTELATAQHRAVQLETELQSEKAAARQVTLELAGAEEKCTAKSEELDVTRAQLATLQQDLQAKLSDIASLETQRVQGEETRMALQRDLQAVGEQLDASKTQVADLQRALSNGDESIKQQLALHADEVRALQDALSNAKNRVGQLESDVCSANAMSAALHSKLSTSEARTSALSHDLVNTETSLLRANAWCEALQAECNHAHLGDEALAMELVALELRAGELGAQFAELQASLEVEQVSSSALQVSLQRCNASIEDLQAQVASKTAMCESLQSSAEQGEAERMEVLKAREEELLLCKEALAASRQEFDKSKTLLEQSEHASQALAREISALKQRLEASQTACSALESRLEAQAESGGVVHAAWLEEQAKRVTLESELANKQVEIAQTAEIVERLQNAVSLGAMCAEGEACLQAAIRQEQALQFNEQASALGECMRALALQTRLVEELQQALNEESVRLCANEQNAWCNLEREGQQAVKEWMMRAEDAMRELTAVQEAHSRECVKTSALEAQLNQAEEEWQAKVGEMSDQALVLEQDKRKLGKELEREGVKLAQLQVALNAVCMDFDGIAQTAASEHALEMFLVREEMERHHALLAEQLQAGLNQVLLEGAALALNQTSLEHELEQALATVESLANRSGESSNQVLYLQNEVSSERGKTSEALAKCAQQAEEIKDLTAFSTDLATRVEVAQAASEQARAELDALDAKLQEQVHTAARNIAAMEQEASFAREEAGRLREAVQDAAQEIAALQTQLRAGEQEIARLDSKLLRVDGENNVANAQVIAALQTLINEQAMEAAATEIEYDSANDALLEWARVDCDRLVWERTCQAEEEMQKLEVALARLQEEKAELEHTLQDKDMYIKCLQVQTDQMELARAQALERMDEIQVGHHFVVEDLLNQRLVAEEHMAQLQELVNSALCDARGLAEERAQASAELQAEKQQMLWMNDERMQRLREETMAEMNARFEHMKRSKNYWISRLQVEMNELALELEMTELERSFCVANKPSPFLAVEEAGKERTPLVERSATKRMRISNDVENTPVCNHGEILGKLCKLVRADSLLELETQIRRKLGEMEGELLLLRERNEKLESAKLTRAQAEQISQLKREYVALKAQVANAQPASQESIAKYERQCAEALRTRDEALERLKQMVETTRKKEAELTDTAKFQVQQLERENLLLYKRIRELGGIPNMM